MFYWAYDRVCPTDCATPISDLGLKFLSYLTVTPPGNFGTRSETVMPCRINYTKDKIAKSSVKYLRVPSTISECFKLAYMIDGSCTPGVLYVNAVAD